MNRQPRAQAAVTELQTIQYYEKCQDEQNKRNSMEEIALVLVKNINTGGHNHLHVSQPGQL